MASERSSRPHTKDLLRAHALELVAAKGLAGLSIRTLCQRVGIRESSFYAHFASKDALLEELLRDAGADAPLRIAEQLAAARLPMADYVSRLTESLLALWSDPQVRTVRVLLEAEAARSPALRARFNEGVLSMIGAVAAELGRGMAAGELRGPAEPFVMAWALVSPIAALRATLLAHGAHAAHAAHGQGIARAHVAAWLLTHSTARTS
jgi:AcrR family transcriptional regulator